MNATVQRGRKVSFAKIMHCQNNDVFCVYESFTFASSVIFRMTIQYERKVGSRTNRR